MATKKVKEPEITAEEQRLQRSIAVRKAREDAKRAERDAEPKHDAVTKGPVDRITDVLVNPTDDMRLESTNFDRYQVSLIPQVLAVDDMWQFLYDITDYRDDPKTFAVTHDSEMPVLENQRKKYVNVLAKVRRSLGGRTLATLENLALADLERRSTQDESDYDKIGEYGD